MLTYKMNKIEGDLILYDYYPEGNGAVGTVSINTETGETAVVKSSKDDFGNYFAFKLIKRLKSFYEEKNYRQDGIVAWY